MNDQEILEFLYRLRPVLLRPDGTSGVVITKETTRPGKEDECTFEEDQ